MCRNYINVLVSNTQKVHNFIYIQLKVEDKISNELDSYVDFVTHFV